VAALLCAGCPRATRLEPARLPLVYSALNLPRASQGSFRPGELRGKVVLVSFFATWCFPCLADLPVLEKLKREHGSQGFEVVAVGMDLEGAKVLEPFADQYQLPFPVLVADEPIRSGESPFGRISALPTSMLFERVGTLLFGYQGVASPERLLAVVADAVRR
jgi:thiol-disulfide isomerase/thioredoxin